MEEEMQISKIMAIAAAFCLCSCQDSKQEHQEKEEQLAVAKIYSIGSVGSHLTPQAGNTYNPENLIDHDTATTWALPFKGNGSVILDFHISAENGKYHLEGRTKGHARFSKNHSRQSTEKHFPYFLKNKFRLSWQ